MGIWLPHGNKNGTNAGRIQAAGRPPRGMKRIDRVINLCYISNEKNNSRYARSPCRRLHRSKGKNSEYARSLCRRLHISIGKQQQIRPAIVPPLAYIRRNLS